MNPLENEVLQWWKGFRPIGWTILAHIENPTINTVTDREKNLAKKAAEIARLKYERSGKKR